MLYSSGGGPQASSSLVLRGEEKGPAYRTSWVASYHNNIIITIVMLHDFYAQSIGNIIQLGSQLNLYRYVVIFYTITVYTVTELQC